MDRLLDFLLNTYGPTPYFLIFGILLACGLGLPIPEDLTLIASGAIAFYGETRLWITMVVAFLGVLTGDSIIFTLGRVYGRRLTRIWIFHKLLPDDRLVAVQNRFHKRGNKLIFAARFMPGLRAPVFFSSGTLHLPYRIFIFYDGMAALISVPLIIGGVYIFGEKLDLAVKFVQRIEHGVTMVAAAVVVAIVGKWYLTHRRLKRSEMR